MTPRRRIAAVLAITSVLALAGCGRDAEPGACSLLDQETIQDEVGRAFSRGTIDEDLTTDTISVCAWRPSSGTFPVILVYVSAGAEQVTAQRQEADDGFGVPSVDLEIAGASDAYAAGDGSIIGMVVGDSFIQVAYIATAPADVFDAMTALAEEAAAKAVERL